RSSGWKGGFFVLFRHFAPSPHATAPLCGYLPLIYKERQTSSLTPGPSLFVCCLFYFPFPKCARLYDRPLLSVPCLISFIEMRGFTCCSRFKLSVHHVPLCLSGARHMFLC